MNLFRKALTRVTLLLAVLFTCTSQADVMDRVLERETLRVGVPLFAPWVMLDDKGELIGFEIEVAKKLATEMGVAPEFKVYPWPEIIPALDKGEVDVIIAGMAITPKRALQLNFSIPYAEQGTVLAANTALTKDIGSLEELNRPGVTAVAVAKTLGWDVAKLIFDKAEVQTVPDPAAATKAVLEGKAHVYVTSAIEASQLALNNPELIDVPLEKPLMTSVSGMGVKKGEHALLHFLNAWITARAADRWLAATHKYWFKSLGWLEQVKP